MTPKARSILAPLAEFSISRKFRSISTGIVIALCTGLLLPALIVGLAIETLRQEQLQNEVKRDLTDKVSVLAQSLVDPLWNIDRELAKTIAEAALLDPQVVRVSISDSELNPFLSIERQERRLGTSQAEKRALLRRDTILGFVELEIDNGLRQRELQEDRRSYAIIFIAQFVLALTLILIAIRLRVLKPLTRLTAFSDQLASGKLDQPIDLDRPDELGNLARQMDQMRCGLQSAFAEQRAILHNVQVGVFFVRERVIQLANRQAEQMFGYAHGTMNGLTPRSVYLTDEQFSSVRQQAYEAIASDNGQFDAEVQLKTFDGSPFLVHMRGCALDPQAPQAGSIWSFRDITESKQMEMAFERTRKGLRQIIDLIPGHVWVKDGSGKFLMINEANARSYGMSVEALTGSLHSETHPDKEQVAKMLQDDRRVLETGLPLFAPEVSFTGADGVVRCLQIAKIPFNFAETGAPAVLGIATDITESKRIEQELRESEERWKFALEGAGDGVWDWNIQTGAALFSRRWKEMIGFAENEIENNASEWSSRVHPEDLPKVMVVIQDHIDGKTPSANIEFRMLCKDGSWLWTLGRGIVVSRDADGKPIRLVGTNTDITERKAAADKIEYLAFHDLLTELPNRRLLLDRLEHAMVSSARHYRYGALMLLDMDDFKTLNDTLGHDVGDQFLVEVARRLQAAVRDGDTVARHGGDEFVVILEDLTEGVLSGTQAENVATKILHAVSQPYLLDLTVNGGVQNTRGYHCTSSIGITLFQGHAVSADELMKRADTAMYQAKAAGRNTLRFFDPEMQAEVAARAALDNDLREALEEGQFCLYYQPQVDHAGHWTGAEALVRWQHPGRGLVSPAQFIPQTEATGLILPLGNWVLETACQQLVAWDRLPATAHLTVAVNISARQFRQAGFVDQVLAIIDRTGANPTKLKLELTESLLLENVADIIVKMTALKAKGVGFSLDDFGTGYSSLAYLKRLPLDQLKIDPSFVRDVLTDPNDAAIARTIVALAHSMGLAVIAEGVETEAQREFLAANGCTAYQGYLFGRPMPIADFLQKF